MARRGISALLLAFRSDELIAFAMNIDDLNRRVGLEMFTELGDVHIHRTGVEVVVINPYGLESIVALQNLVNMRAEQAQQLALLCGELGHLVVDHKHLFLGVEGEAAYLVHGHLLALLALYTAEYGLDVNTSSSIENGFVM